MKGVAVVVKKKVGSKTIQVQNNLDKIFLIQTNVFVQNNVARQNVREKKI